LEKPLINFGKVIFGEKKTLKLVLDNTGALESAYEIKSVSG
jgi:hypothetical protein